MAELADAQDSGSCGRKVVEVQVLSPALEACLQNNYLNCSARMDSAKYEQLSQLFYKGCPLIPAAEFSSC